MECDEESRAAILARSQRLMDLYESQDFSDMAGLYAEDAVLIPSGATFIPVQAVEEAMRRHWDAGIRHIFSQSDEMISQGDLVVDRGHYVYVDAEGEVKEKGKSLMVWVKKNGEWFIKFDMWNEGYEG